MGAFFLCAIAVFYFADLAKFVPKMTNVNSVYSKLYLG